ncbi:MAG: hypothetical protein JRJ20_15825, partial [Deltaproteobacteria bacterium]|nr:hypothetical protein [Deltaproteobacteria bacterium]
MKKLNLIWLTVFLSFFSFTAFSIVPPFTFAWESQGSQSFNSLNIGSKADFTRLTTSEKAEYLERLSESEKKELFDTLSQSEKERLFRKYPELLSEIASESTESLLPRREPFETFEENKRWSAEKQVGTPEEQEPPS